MNVEKILIGVAVLCVVIFISLVASAVIQGEAVRSACWEMGYARHFVERADIIGKNVQIAYCIRYPTPVTEGEVILLEFTND